jgi:quinol-cytochrome oxidoreductase complex cytochrome b subunit
VDDLVERTGLQSTSALQRAQRVLLGVLAFLVLVLLVSGLWLTFRYRPGEDTWQRAAHRITAMVFVVGALLTFGVSIAVSYERRLRAGLPAWVAGFVLFLGAGTAAISGYLLPWDDLGLLTVNKRLLTREGYGWLFNGEDVRYVLVGSQEVAASALRQWYLAHAIVFPVALVALGAVLWRVTRRGRLFPLEPEPARDSEPSAAPPG